MCDLGAMAYAYNLIPWQVEAAGSETESHPRRVMVRITWEAKFLRNA